MQSRLHFVLACGLATLMTVGCSAPTSAPATAETPPSAPDPKDVLEREAERVRLLTAGDLDQLATVLSPTLTYTHSSAALDTKETFLESLRSGATVYRSLTHRDVDVRFVTPDVAILNGLSVAEVTVGGEERTVPLRFTIVYVRKDGEWLFDAWHSARLPD